MARYEELSIGELTIPSVDSPNKGSLLSLSLTPASVATIVAAKQTFTVSGLLTTDHVIPLSNPITNAVAITTAEVSAADTLRVTFVNPTAGALTPTAGVYTFLVIRTV